MLFRSDHDDTTLCSEPQRFERSTLHGGADHPTLEDWVCGGFHRTCGQCDEEYTRCDEYCSAQRAHDYLDQTSLPFTFLQVRVTLPDLALTPSFVHDPPAFGDAIDTSPDPEPSLSVPRAMV